MATLNQVGVQNALSVTTSAVALTLPTGRSPSHMIVYNNSGNPLRWRSDGTAPTSTNGMLLLANSYLEWMDPNFNYGSIIARIQFIRDSTAAGNGTLEVSFFSQ